MARYDDASRSLHRLERQLYQAEYGDEENEDPEEDFDEEYDEYSDEEDDGEYDDDYEEEDEEAYDEDWEEEEADPRSYHRRPGRHTAFRRAGYDRYDEDTAMAPRQNRRVGKLLLLALGELLAIYAIIRWWIQWL